MSPRTRNRGALVRPADIDDSFVPIRRHGVHGVELDGEAVLYDQRSERFHLLNWTGWTVWSLLDAETSVADLASELAEAFNADSRAVRTDLIQLLVRLGDQGLLEGVEVADVGAGIDEHPRAPRARTKETDA